MPMTTTTCSSRGSADDSASLLELAAARAFFERDRRQDVRAHGELARLAQHAAARVDQARVGEDRELDRAGARLTRREVPGDPGARVVLDGDAMADQIVQLRVIRHRAAYITP